MLKTTGHNLLNYITDGMLIACTWTYQHLPFSNVDWIALIGGFGEIIDLLVKPIITLILLATAYNRYRKSKKKKPNSDKDFSE